MLRLFMVDDSELTRGRLASMVSEIGGVELVGQAADASTALAGIKAASPDVVILDIRLPGGSGIGVLERLKTAPVSPVVIMLSAFPNHQYRTRCAEAGADYFFDKTSEFDRVIELLQELRYKPSALKGARVDTMPATSIVQNDSFPPRPPFGGPA